MISGTDVMEKLEGRTFSFFGVCNEQFKLDDTVYEAVEDEDDGYRSMLKAVIVAPEAKGIFFQKSVAKVICTELEENRKDGIFSGWVFTELLESGPHVWLTVGTGNSDDYYPYFVFNYKPRRAP
ncbi:MAG: hypothetical protein Q7R39_01305 [Dehalococcoidia bacterium]|nr:hypothetical protein [Dehalococcoidia bacterium]